jgi:hypothetical protein
MTTNLSLFVFEATASWNLGPFGFTDAWIAGLDPHSAIGYTYFVPTVSEEFASTDPFLSLNDKGCATDDSFTSHNCTEACLDPQRVWNDPMAMFTMHNCISYVAISQMLALNRLTDTSRQTASDYGILDAPSINLLQIIETISGCIEQYCSGNECGGTDPSGMSYAEDVPCNARTNPSFRYETDKIQRTNGAAPILYENLVS